MTAQHTALCVLVLFLRLASLVLSDQKRHTPAKLPSSSFVLLATALISALLPSSGSLDQNHFLYYLTFDFYPSPPLKKRKKLNPLPLRVQLLQFLPHLTLSHHNLHLQINFPYLSLYINPTIASLNLYCSETETTHQLYYFLYLTLIYFSMLFLPFTPPYCFS